MKIENIMPMNDSMSGFKTIKTFYSSDIILNILMQIQILVTDFRITSYWI